MPNAFVYEQKRVQLWMWSNEITYCVFLNNQNNIQMQRGTHIATNHAFSRRCVLSIAYVTINIIKYLHTRSHLLFCAYNRFTAAAAWAWAHTHSHTRTCECKYGAWDISEYYKREEKNQSEQKRYSEKNQKKTIHDMPHKTLNKYTELLKSQTVKHISPCHCRQSLLLSLTGIAAWSEEHDYNRKFYFYSFQPHRQFHSLQVQISVQQLSWAAAAYKTKQKSLCNFLCLAHISYKRQHRAIAIIVFVPFGRSCCAIPHSYVHAMLDTAPS